MEQMILVKYGEIILKGMNRPVFEDMLIRNIKKTLKNIDTKIWKSQATIYIEPADISQMDDIVAKCQKVFGIVSITKAYALPKDLDKIKTGAVECLKDALSSIRTFKVEAKRSDKKFPLKSPEICQEIGGHLYTAFPHLEVDVKNPDKVVLVEIREKNAFISCDKVPGAGGMPIGSSAQTTLLLSGGIDSPVAGYMVAKRGASVNAVHFFSHPYTSDRAKEKVLELARIVGQYTGGMAVHIVPFTDIQLAIRQNCPEEQLTLIMRRFMMKIAERIAVDSGSRALVTGESIGQVASQTIEALAVTDHAVNIPVFRPVIGMDKDEIVTISRKIGTFETSILPYEDCCTIFTPKHPSTKPVLENIIQSEQTLDAEQLIKEATAGTEVVYV